MSDIRTGSTVVRVQNADRYSMMVGVDVVHVKCLECFERRKHEWIFAFKARGLPEILAAVLRHDQDAH